MWLYFVIIPDPQEYQTGLVFVSFPGPRQMLLSICWWLCTQAFSIYTLGYDFCCQSVFLGQYDFMKSKMKTDIA